MPIYKVTNPTTGANVSIRWRKALEKQHPELPIWMKMGVNMFEQEIKQGADRKKYAFVFGLNKEGILSLYDASLRYFKGKLREVMPLNHDMGAYVGCRMQMQAHRLPILDYKF